MRSLFGLLIGIGLSLLLTMVAGENPLHVSYVIAHSALGSLYDFGQVLYYSTSLIFTGLSVCIAYHAGLFNIGAEGQLSVGTLAMCAVGILFPQLPAAIAPLVAVLAGIVAAGIWGFIPGFLRSYRGSHEVIVTMMMNFIAAGVVNYFIVGALKNSESQNPETAAVAPQYMFAGWDPIRRFIPDSPANFSFVIAVVLAVLIWVLLKKTTWGFKIKTAGESENVATTAGLSAKRIRMWAMFAAGAIAGMVGLNEILGSVGKFRMGFSPEFGFVGIAVALLARSQPIAIIFSALLFGVLQKGSSDLDLETNFITRDFAHIIQAVIILSVAAVQLWPKSKKGKS